MKNSRLRLLVATAFLLSLAFPNPASAGSVSFASPQVYGVGLGPWAVAVGDFSGGGGLDLAVVNYLTNTISVLAGNGDGTFGVASTYAAGGGPASVVADDVNGDGKLDLVVANFLSTTVSVLLGNGNGTFQPARNFAAGPNPSFAAVGDVNGDGKRDLVATNYYANTISVLLGNGDGTFGPAQIFYVAPNPQVVTVRDLNGDGKLDLAVANSGSTVVSVLLGRGDGTFQPPLTYEVGDFNPTYVAVGDVNGDGKLDLVVPTYGCFYYAPCPIVSQTVSVLLGNGDGTFQPARLFAAGSGPNSVVVGDFNHDGKTDLAVADYGPSTQRATTVSVLLGNGDGTFQPPLSFNAGTSPAFVVGGDFNFDGVLDLAVANYDGGTVSVLIGAITQQQVATPTFSPAGGTFASPQSVAIPDATPGATIYYTTDGSTPTTASPAYSGPILVMQTTTIQAMATASGMTNSAVASATYTFLQQVATPTFTPAGGTYTSPQSVAIADATPGATIYYTTDGSTPTTASPAYGGAILVTQTTTIQAMATAGGMTNSAVASATYAILQQVATPTFSPAAGTYTLSVTVTISDSTAGAAIHYTTDGSTPTTASPVYSGPILVTQTTTIQAMAAAGGMADSAVASATYTILQQVATPTFSPAAGTYTSSVIVTISDSTAGATIHYTTDGSTPTTSSPVYTGSITVAQTTTIKAMATAGGMANSAVASATYTIVQQVATPAFSPAAGTYTSSVTVTISDSTAGATIYYTTDGSTPTTASPVYAGSVTVTQATTVKAMAAASGMTNSAVASAPYTIRVATPTFSPGGGTYSGPRSVSISDTTPGATIYYTTNGSTPTTASPVYTGAITVAQTTTVKAMGAASGMTNSAVASATYTIQQSFTLTVSVQNGLTGSGHVASSPGGINCGGGTCSATFASGTVVNLSAIPDGLLSIFVSWGGACSGILDPSCTVTMTGNLSVSATFGP